MTNDEVSRSSLIRSAILAVKSTDHRPQTTEPRTKNTFHRPIRNPQFLETPMSISLFGRSRRVVLLGLAATLSLGAAGMWWSRPSLDSVVPNKAETVATPARTIVDPHLTLCQELTPAAPNAITGVDCVGGNCGACGTGGGEATWKALGPIPWQTYAQGEYVGHERTVHIPVYRLRVDDQLDIVYRLSRHETARPYEMNVGDEIRVESFTDEKLNRNLIIQPDGTITLPMLGQLRGARLTVAQLREELENQYKKYYKVPAITVIPLKVNTKLDDLRNTVDARAGTGGQRLFVRVTPEGTIQLPAIGSVYTQGLTLDELKREIDARYAVDIEGIEVTPVLSARAPRFVYVVGEVVLPGRYSLEGPTTTMQAIALAGSWNVGANLRQIVVFRRGDDWRLMATMLDLQGALYGKRPCPADEIWLNDSDIVVVPKSPIKWANEFIEQVFTRGIYGVLPFQGVSMNFTNATRL
jgi:polysaccharide export outer membrane protein